MLQTCLSRRERDSNPRAVASKLISSKWECVPYRPGSYLKYADFWGFLRDCTQFMRNLRENCGMAARWGDGDRNSSLTFAGGSIGKLMGFDIFDKGFHAL